MPRDCPAWFWWPIPIRLPSHASSWRRKKWTGLSGCKPPILWSTIQHHFRLPPKRLSNIAVNLWESRISSPVTIVIDASWRPLGSGVLGSAGATNIYGNFPGAPFSDTWYFSALANKLSSSDLCQTSDSQCTESGADIEASFNSTFPSWYLGTGGAPGPGQYDFVSVVLHEIAHGLGFAGSMGVGTGYGCSSGAGCWGYGTGSPVIYDRFTENGAGQRIIVLPEQFQSAGCSINHP